MKRLLLSTIVLLCACAKQADRPFDPAEARVVTENSDKMTHCSAFLVDGGTIYFSYYHDPVQTLEIPTATTIVPVLAKADFPALTNIERTEVIRAGQTVGDFTQDGWRAPYDPNILRIGDGILYYFVGCADSTVTYCVRRYDIPSGSFAPTVEPCTLSYKGKKVVMNTRNLQQMFLDFDFPAVFNNDMNMSAPFVEYKGEFYNTIGSAFLKRACPIVVKTSDGIDFEVVMLCTDFLYGNCESSLAILGDEFYVIHRNSGVERGGRGCYIAKYSPDGKCLVPPQYLSEAQAKPVLAVHKGKLYAFYNANPFLQTDWGLVSRSRMRVARIGRDCSVLHSWDVTSPFGIHYPYVQTVNGDLWLSFSEDRKQLDVNQTRSNISLIKTDL